MNACLGRAAGDRTLRAASALFLNRRARHVAVGAEDAAIALLGLHLMAACLAMIDVLAGIGGHGLGRGVPALGTSNG